MSIQNPGSALGEAIGAQMEEALNHFCSEIVGKYDCHFISKGPKNKTTGRFKKLLMYDDGNNAYNIDSVVVNESMQPLILIECKYIRYTKHNRDKGSWVCTAHSAIRRKYESIRSSIAVLAGNWSASSVAMMKSHGTNVFLVPFSIICDLLSRHRIDFDWDEKNREQATTSWGVYNTLTPKQKYSIGEKMIEHVGFDLESVMSNILDSSVERSLDKLTLEFHTNIGEIFTHNCANIEEAIELLSDFNFDIILDTTDAPTIFKE